MPLAHAGECFAKGIMVLLTHFAVMAYTYSPIQNTTEYGFVKRNTVAYVYSHGYALKFWGAFLVSKGSSMLSGLAYNGEKKVDETLIPDWSGCKNNNTYMVSLLFII